MPKTIPAFTSPVAGDVPDIALIKANDDALRAFAIDHDASHWPIKVSAPKLGAGGVSAAVASTGGTMVLGTKYGRFTYETPNGETARSSEQSVVLSGAQNAIQYTVDQANDQFTPYLWVYQAVAGATVGAGPWYRCRSADLTIVSGAGASVDANGRITLSTSAPTVFKVIAHPPNTQPTAPTANSSGSIDPLQMTVVPIPFTSSVTNNSPVSGQKTVTKTYTLAGGVVTEIGIYDKLLNRLLATAGHEVRMNGIAIARYDYTFGTDLSNGAVICTSRTQVEA